MVNRIAVDNGLAYLICMRDLVTARGGARLQDALKACRDLKYEGDGIVMVIAIPSSFTLIK